MFSIHIGKNISRVANLAGAMILAEKIHQVLLLILSNSRGTVNSYHILSHSIRQGHIIVPQPRKDLGKGLVNKLLKQAGLK